MGLGSSKAQTQLAETVNTSVIEGSEDVIDKLTEVRRQRLLENTL